MSYYVALQVGCTAIYIPGWAAIGAVLVAAAPRLAWMFYRDRTGQ